MPMLSRYYDASTDFYHLVLRYSYVVVSSLSCPLCVQLHRPVVTVWFALVFTVLFTDD